MKRLFVTLSVLLLGHPVFLSAQIKYAALSVFCTGLNVPNQIVFDSSGNLFVANHSYASYSGPYHNTIAKIDPAGNKSVFLSGYMWPSGICIDQAQNLFFTQNNASSNITKVTPSGTASTFASLPHQPGTITIFDNGNPSQFSIYTVSHWGVKGIQKTDYSGTPTLFNSGAFYGCQLSTDGQTLFTFGGNPNNLMTRFNLQAGTSQSWVTVIQDYEVWASTIGPEGKLYIIARSNCNAQKKAVFRIDGMNAVTEVVNDLPYNSEFNDLAFKKNGNTYDLYLSEVVSGNRNDPAANRIIKFTNAFGFGALNLTVDPCTTEFCQGDTARFTAHGLAGLPPGSLQWFVNGLPVYGGNLNNGLVGYWPFNGNANDFSGNGNHAAEVSATLTADRFGNPNSAYNFAGLSNPQIIRVPNSPSLQFTNKASFSLWVYMNSYYGMDGWGNPTPVGVHMLFSKDFDQCCLYEAVVGMANGNFITGGCTNGWYSGINFSDTVPGSGLGQWVNLTYVYTPTEGRIYSNGQLIASKTGTTTFNNANGKDLYFGRLNWFWYPLNGKLDEVRFYNRALSPAEVNALYLGVDTTFSYVPQNGDVVTCVYTSTGTPPVTLTSNALTMTVHPRPVPVISGPAVICAGSGNITYTTQAGLTTYTWSVSAGGTILSGAGTNTITVNWTGTGAQWVKVSGSNSFGCAPTSPANLNVQVNPLPADLGEQPGLLPSLKNGLAANYPFNGNVRDASGNGHNGTNHGAQLTTDRCNTPNSAFLFNGTSNYLSVDSAFFDNGWAQYSISMWFNSNDVNKLMQCVFNTNPHNGLDLMFNYTNDKKFSYFVNSNPSVVAWDIYHNERANQVFQQNQWYHVVFQKNGNGYSVYINGLLDHSTIGSISPISYLCRLYIGGISLNSEFFKGKIDDIRVYTRNLTVPEIANLYSAGCAMAVSLAEDTICGASFNDNLFIHNSEVGISYQLLKDGTNFGTPLTGNGNTLSFPITGLTQTSAFTVRATNPATTCNILLDTTLTVVYAPINAVVSPNTAICSGTSATLTASGGSGYLWSNGMTTSAITVTPVATTTYYVTVTNTVGCWDKDSVKVTLYPMPAPTIAGSTAMCVNSGYYHYTTETGMNNYQWSVSPGATIVWGTGTPELILTWDQPGAQWVRVNYAHPDGCTAGVPTQLDVSVNPLPGAAGPVTGPAVVCAGSTGLVYSTPLIPNAVTYVWSLPPGAAIVSGTGSNVVTVSYGPGALPGNVTVYGNNLCGNGTLSTPLAVNVGALPGNAGTPTGEIQVCEGDTGVIYYCSPVLNASSYLWELTGGGIITTGNGTNSVRVTFPAGSTSGTIAVTGINSCGQGATSSPLAVTVNPIPATPVITQSGETLISSASSGNQWYLNGNLIPWATEQSYTPQETGTYSVRVTLFTCESAVSASYYFIMTGVNSSRPTAHFTIYPVPNDGLFNLLVQGSFPEGLELSVINELGIRLFRQVTSSISGSYETLIDLRPAVPGLYTVLFEHDGNRWIRKVVVNH